MAGPSVIAARALLLALALTQSTDLRTEVDRLVAATVAARGLPYRGTLPAKAMPRAEMRAAIDAAVRAGASDPAVAREGEILRRLGLLPGPVPGNDKGSDDYAALLSRSYTAAAPKPAPFYDVAAGRLLIPDFVPLAEQRLLLAHEIAHAIADQRFGLRRAMGLGPDGRRQLDGDAQRARVALIEGDATLTALATIDPRETFLGPSALGTLLERMRAAPTTGLAPWLATLSRFVHAEGLRFAAVVRAGSPWSAVDALWTDPPASTEQVLHPESYHACDEPIPIAADAFPALPDFGRPTASDVLGELVVRAWLETAVPPGVAARAAAGWGGDRVALYTQAATTRGDGGTEAPPPLLWLTLWDDSGEAADFAAAARAALAETIHASTPDVTDTSHAVFSTGSGTSASLIRRGDAVAVLLDVPDGALATAEQIVGAAGRARTGPTKRAGEVTPPRPRGGRPRPAAPPGCPRRDRATAPR